MKEAGRDDKGFLERRHAFIYMSSMAAFLPQQQSLVVATETHGPPSQRYFISGRLLKSVWTSDGEKPECYGDTENGHTSNF